MNFLAQHKWVILFYSFIILIVFAYRHKFDMHGILALYRTKIGLKTMGRLASKYRELVKLWGYIGIGAAYVGLVVISYVLIKNVVELVFIPSTVSAVTPVLPGVKVPGTEFTIPLVTGWICLFVVIVIHEFSHGVVARAHNKKIKSSGLFFLGPLMGAFVEPDENEIRKSEDVVQYSVLAAGPFSNMITAAVVLAVLFYVVTPVQGLFVEPSGFELNSILEKLPAEDAGLEPGMVVTSVNDVQVSDRDMFVEAMDGIKAGEVVALGIEGKNYPVKTTLNPTNNRTAYLGITGTTNFGLKNVAYKYPYAAFKWVVEFIQLLGALSLGIGLINLFPIFITDGARMLQVSLLQLDKKNGLMLWKHANSFCLMVLGIGLLLPFFRWLIG